MLSFRTIVLSVIFVGGTDARGANFAFLVACGAYDGDLKRLPFAVKETREFRDVLVASGYDSKNVKLLADDAERRVKRI